MKVLAICVFLLACASLSAAVALKIYGHTFYWPSSFGTDFYPYSPLTGTLPFLNEDQLCFGIGVLSGCSGCEHGAQGLCRWVSLKYPSPPSGDNDDRWFTCLEKDFASALVLAKDDEVQRQFLDGKAIRDVEYESQICTVDPRKSSSIQGSFYSLSDLKSHVVWPRSSVIFHTYHEMDFADVPKKPWAVDATSAWGDAGAMRLWGMGLGTILPTGRDPILARIDCGDLNDPEVLSKKLGAVFSGSTIVSPADTVNNNLFLGIVRNARSRWCANLIMGSYLSSRCPEYGRAISGIELSAYLHFVQNCAASRGNEVTPLLITTAGPVPAPYSSIPFYVVPDGTPYALRDVPIMPNEKWEEWLGLDDVGINYHGIPVIFGFIPVD
jgi:hypothetical protein